MHTAISTSRHNAEREYDCDICDNVIEKGERYQRTTGIENGDFLDVKICLSHPEEDKN